MYEWPLELQIRSALVALELALEVRPLPPAVVLFHACRRCLDGNPALDNESMDARIACSGVLAPAWRAAANWDHEPRQPLRRNRVPVRMSDEEWERHRVRARVYYTGLEARDEYRRAVRLGEVAATAAMAITLVDYAASIELLGSDSSMPIEVVAGLFGGLHAVRPGRASLLRWWHLVRARLAFRHPCFRIDSAEQQEVLRSWNRSFDSSRRLREVLEMRHGLTPKRIRELVRNRHEYERRGIGQNQQP